MFSSIHHPLSKLPHFQIIIGYGMCWANPGLEFTHWFSERITCFWRKNEQMSDLLQKKAICSWSLIFCEQPERFAHGCSFLVSNLSKLLIVAHFWWATWVFCSHRSFLMRDLSLSLTSLIKKEGISKSLIF